MDSNTIKKLDKENIAHTYGRFDMVADHGKGAVCVDADGKEYIDFTSGIGVNSLGFCNDAWVKAVTEQASKLQHVSNLYYTGPGAELAGKLCSRTGMSKVFFCNSGAEANECAIKTARKYGNESSSGHKHKIITMKESFHGRTLATVTATGQDNFHKLFDPFLAGFDYCSANDTEELKQKVDDETCAVMMEMIQGEGGLNVLSSEFVQAAAEICRDRDVLFIIDEVQTGVGRTGKFFSYEHFGVHPDIVTFAKGIGGGLPIGGVLFDKKTSEVLQPGDHGSTYGANPVACAGALEVMKQMDQELLDDIAAKGSYIVSELKAIDKVEEVTGMGMMLGFRASGIEAKDIVAACLEKGLMTLTAKDKVRMLPPLTITKEEIDRGLEIIRTVLA